IHYVSRVYFRTVASLKDADNVERALADAVKVIRHKVSALKKKKGADEQIRYLESLPAKWQRGCKYQRKNRKRDTTALFFLGDPIRLPVPMRKRGTMIPIGFSMTMEQLMSAEPGEFKC
ncbi:MAG: hypothetical protein JSW46_05110, partial [Gemmatimonadota bacterium]